MKRSTQLWYLRWTFSHKTHKTYLPFEGPHRLKFDSEARCRHSRRQTLSYNFIQGLVSLSKNLNISQASALENGIRMGFNIVQHIAHLLENLPSTSTFSFFVATSLPPDLKDSPHQSTRVEIQDREKRHMTHPTRLELRHMWKNRY